MFKHAVQTALPKMEEDIEREMLERYQALLPEDTYKELMMSYRERKIQEDEIRIQNKPVKYPAKIQDDDAAISAFNNWFDRKDINDIGNEHIGLWLPVE